MPPNEKKSNALKKRAQRAGESIWIGLIVAIAGGSLWGLLGVNFQSPFIQATSPITVAVVSGTVTLALQLYHKLNQGISVIERINENIEPISESFSPLIKSKVFALEESIQSWRQKLLDVGTRAERYTLDKIIDHYLDTQVNDVKDEELSTNSGHYTRMVEDITEFLYHKEVNNGKRRNGQHLLRFQVTAMLPEEFFNGPQIEYTKGSSRPVFFCHKWEGEDADYTPFYNQDSTINTGVLHKRKILVRDLSLKDEVLSAFSSFSDLQEQKQLRINEVERSLADVYNGETPEDPAVIQRLVRLSKMLDAKSISDIHGYQNYHYWRIAHSGHIKECKNNGWDPLFDLFASKFHAGQSNGAEYCVLDEKGWKHIKQMDSALPHRSFMSGWTPEVTLFARCDDKHDPLEWYCGVLGFWRPFTRDMRVRFLSHDLAEEYYNFYQEMHRSSSVSGKLQSLPTSPLSN